MFTEQRHATGTQPGLTHALRRAVRAQRSRVFAIDATDDINERWTLGGKYAWHRGELRANRDNSSPWFKSAAELAVLRVKEKDRKNGWVTAACYHVNERGPACNDRRSLLGKRIRSHSGRRGNALRRG